MTGRTWLALAALMATSMGLAGCIEAFDQFDPDGAGITAMEDQDLAANAAAAWHPEAFLLGAASLETSDARAGVPLDDTPGDGRSAFWYYAYGAPETEDHRLFRVTQDGQVTVEEDLPPMMRGLDFEQTALDGWVVDSDAAAASVAATEAVAGVFDAGNLSVMAGVGMTPDEATWVVTALSDNGFAVALVDAKTGEVEVQDVEMADLQAFAGDVPMPTMAAFFPDVHIEDEGTLDDDERMREYAFSAGEGMQGRFEVRAEPSYAHERFEYWIVDSDGEAVLYGRITQRDGGEQQVHEFALEREGDHTLIVRHVAPLDWMTHELAMGEVDFGFDLLVSHQLPEPVPEEPDA